MLSRESTYHNLRNGLLRVDETTTVRRPATNEHPVVRTNHNRASTGDSYRSGGVFGDSGAKG